jgi:hypothetical protein
MKRPAIPDWVKQLFHPKYRNIYSYRLGNENLWGTETLLGDWGGEYLLITQDFAPTSYIEARRGTPNPYSHDPYAFANIQLLKTLRHFRALGKDHVPVACNFMYISACFLLREGNPQQGAELPDKRRVLQVSAPVVRFTMENMPRLKTLVLMGQDAALAFHISGGVKWAHDLGLRVCRVRHPAGAMSEKDRFAEWAPVFDGQNSSLNVACSEPA